MPDRFTCSAFVPSGTVTSRCFVLPACIKARMSASLAPAGTAYSPALIASSDPNSLASRRNAVVDRIAPAFSIARAAAASVAPSGTVTVVVAASGPARFQPRVTWNQPPIASATGTASSSSHGRNQRDRLRAMTLSRPRA